MHRPYTNVACGNPSLHVNHSLRFFQEYPRETVSEELPIISKLPQCNPLMAQLSCDLLHAQNASWNHSAKNRVSQASETPACVPVAQRRSANAETNDEKNLQILFAMPPARNDNNIKPSALLDPILRRQRCSASSDSLRK